MCREGKEGRVVNAGLVYAGRVCELPEDLGRTGLRRAEGVGRGMTGWGGIVAQAGGLATSVAVLAIDRNGGWTTTLRFADLSEKVVWEGGGEMLAKGSSSMRYNEGDEVRKLVGRCLGFVNVDDEDEPGCLGADEERGREKESESEVAGADRGFAEVGGD